MRPTVSSLATALACLAATLVATAPAESSASPAPGVERRAKPTLKVTPARPLQATTARFTVQLPTHFRRPATLQRKVNGKWQRVASRRTSAAGRATYRVKVLTTTRYRVRAGAVRRAGSRRPAITSKVRAVKPLLRAELVSRTPSGRPGNGESAFVNISDNGRFVVFHSDADNLVAAVPGMVEGDTNVYLRDRTDGTTTLVSQGIGGVAGNGSSVRPVISRDGRYVAFVSYASNLVAGDGNGAQDVFRWDRLTDTMLLVSRDLIDDPANDDSHDPSISGDGSVIAYSSSATDLAFSDTNGVADVFAWHADTQNSELLSIDDGGGIADGSSQTALVSADGNHVAFASNATDLVVGDTNGTRDTFVRDIGSPSPDTELVSRGVGGAPADDYSAPGAISATGRYVTMSSAADNMVAGDADANEFTNAYLHDTVAGTTRLLSADRTGKAANDLTFAPGSVTDDGSAVLFTSRATDLVAGDTNGEADSFIWRRSSPRPALVIRDFRWGPLDGPVYEPVFSADGRFIAFYSTATDVVPGDGNATTDAFVWRR